MENPKFYLFESKYPKRVHFTTGFKKLLSDLKIEGDLYKSVTRYEYDNSDNTAWVLYYGESKEARNRVIEVRNILHSIEYRKQKVFNVSGNGYGTGVSIMLNYNNFYK
jgi:hypothetical protein